MAVIRLGGFLGEFPKIHPRLIPQGGAVFAEDARLDSGAIEPVRQRFNTDIDFVAELGGDPRLFFGPSSIFKYDFSWFLLVPNDADFAWYSSGRDTFRRLIITGDNFTKPYITSRDLLLNAGVAPPASTLPGGGLRFLEIPAPTTALRAEIPVSPAATDPTDVPETRFYVTTFVDEWGAEGPPSFPSNQVEWREGQQVDLTNLPIPPSEGGLYNIQKVRIYRINTTASGISQYQYVTQLAFGDASSGNVAAITNESPFALITTVEDHGFEVGDEICFDNFSSGGSEGITTRYRTGEFGPTSADTGGIVVAKFGWPSTFQSFQTVYFYDFPNPSTAFTTYEGNEWIIARYRLDGSLNSEGPNAVALVEEINEITGLAVFVSFSISGGNFNDGFDVYVIYTVQVTVAPGHTVVVGDYIHMPRGMPDPNANGEWDSLEDLSFKVTNVVGNDLFFTVVDPDIGDSLSAVAPETGLTGTFLGKLLRDPTVTNLDPSPTGGIIYPGSMRRAIEDISQTNPIVVTMENHTLQDGDTVIISTPNSGMDELDGNTYYVKRLTYRTFELHSAGGAPPASPVDGTGYVAFFPDNGARFLADIGMDGFDGLCTTVVEVPSTSSFRVNVDTSDTGVYPPLLSESGVVTELTAADYTDTRLTENLGEVLSTINYDPPNSAMQGIKFHPAGFFVGFHDNIFSVSEPGAPHAWPLEYRLSTAYPIVGLGIFANNVLITTEGNPYLVTGNSPSGLIMTELESEYACLSKRGIVDLGVAICYPSHDGLILVAPNSLPVNVTQNLFTRQQWQALRPSTFVGFAWEGRYAAFYDDGTVQRTIIIDPLSPEIGVTYVLQHGASAYKSIEDDLIFFISADTSDDFIYEWANHPTAVREYVWESGEFYTPKAINFAAAKIYADTYDQLVFRLYADIDGDGVFAQVGGAYTVTSEKAFRLTSGYRAEKWKVRVSGTDRISQITLATTMQEMATVV